jgi:hypothetical protein
MCGSSHKRERGKQAEPAMSESSLRNQQISQEEVNKGLKEMAEKFKESGGELYQKVG